MNQYSRNHIITIIYNSFSGFTQAFLPLAIIVFSNSKKTETIFSNTCTKALALVGAILLIIGYNILKWYKDVYYIDDNFIVVKKGVFTMERKEIPINKIQTIDISQAIKYRIFNLALMKIDTGNSSFKGSELSFVLKKQLAERLKDDILSNKDINQELNSNNQDIYKDSIITLKDIEDYKEVKVTNKELNLNALTSNIFLGGIVFLGSVYALFDKFVDKILGNKINNADKSLEKVNFNNMDMSKIIIWIILILLFYIIFAFIVTIIINHIKYYEFSVRREKENIIIKYGLLEKKNYVMPVEKISAVYIKQNFLRQIFNLRTLHIETVGYGNEKGESSMLYPIASGLRYKEIIEDVLPEFCLDKQVKKVPKSTLRRFIFAKVRVPIVIFIILTIKFSYGYLSLLILPILILSGYLEYRNSGVCANSSLLCLSGNGFEKVISIIPIEKIQSINSNSNYFQRRKELFNYEVSIQGNVFGTQIKVKNLGAEFREELKEVFP